MNNKYTNKFHILLIGDEKVGKTAIIERYFINQFNYTRKQTIGVDCFDKIKTFDNQEYLFKIWDTAGQEKFASLTKNYYQRADGIILVCSLDSKQTFINLRKWRDSISSVSNEQNIQLMIVANKCDVETKEVNQTDLDEFSRNLKISYFQTSAKDDINVFTAIDTMIEMVYKQGKKNNQGVNLKSKRRGRCCG